MVGELGAGRGRSSGVTTEVCRGAVGAPCESDNEMGHAAWGSSGRRESTCTKRARRPGTQSHVGTPGAFGRCATCRRDVVPVSAPASPVERPDGDGPRERDRSETEWRSGRGLVPQSPASTQWCCSCTVGSPSPCASCILFKDTGRGRAGQGRGSERYCMTSINVSHECW